MHFELFSTEHIPSAIKRYQALSENAFKVLDQRLAGNAFLAGEEYSIADIAHFSWLHIARIIQFDFSSYLQLSAWYERVAARPAVRSDITLPAPATGA